MRCKQLDINILRGGSLFLDSLETPLKLPLDPLTFSMSEVWGKLEEKNENSRRIIWRFQLFFVPLHYEKI